MTHHDGVGGKGALVAGAAIAEEGPNKICCLFAFSISSKPTLSDSNIAGRNRIAAVLNIIQVRFLPVE